MSKSKKVAHPDSLTGWVWKRSPSGIRILHVMWEASAPGSGRGFYRDVHGQPLVGKKIYPSHAAALAAAKRKWPHAKIVGENNRSAGDAPAKSHRGIIAGAVALTAVLVGVGIARRG